MKEKKRYSITYSSGSTGYGWEQETNSIKEARSIAESEHFGKCYTAYVSVWDNAKNEFLYMKHILTYEPIINKL